MSKYTTEVRYICEQAANLEESKGFNDIDTILTACLSNVFNFDFPIFDENYRAVLEKKILKHYYVREICVETVGLWKLFLSTRLNEIMPYYNKLYLSETLEFNPLYDVNLTIDHTFENVKEGNSLGTDAMTGTIGDSGSNSRNISDSTVKDIDTTDTSRDKFSDTPQGSLNGVENDNYLTTARKISDTGTIDETDTYTRTESGTTANTRTYNTTDRTTNENNVNTTEDYVEHVVGKRGNITYSKMIREYREALINIDMMIIDELKDLFFGLW